MVKDFLSEMYRGCEDGCITISTLPDRRNLHLPVSEIDKAAEAVEALGQKMNTYYNTALRTPGLPEYKRGGEEDINTVVCMFSDIDIVGPAHKQEALPKSMKEVQEFLSALPFPEPTYLIDSGNDAHAIWCLDKPYIITDDASRQRIKAISAGFGAFLNREAQKRGWVLDPVQDITRMLRAPGTMNFKSDPPKPCAILAHNDVRHPISAFEPYAVVLKEEPFEPESDLASAERMRGKCAFIDYCIDHAETLLEPWWHAMLSIVALTENGEEKCHEWSSPYPGYDYDETEEYRKRAVKQNKPCSCEYIHNMIGFNCPPESCQNCGRAVKGPIAFCFYSREEQIEKLLSSSTIDDFLDEKNLRLASWAKANAPTLYIRLKQKCQALRISTRDYENAVRAATQPGTTAQQDFFGAINLDGLDTDGLVVPEGWDLNMGGVSHMEMGPVGAYINKITASPVLITRKLEDLDEGTEKLELTFYRNHRWKSIILPRGDAMDKGKIVKSANLGLNVSSGNAANLVRFLAEFEAANEDTLRFSRSIDRLGWVNGTKEFYPYHMKDEVAFEASTSEASRLVKSVKSFGDREKWMEMAAKLRTMPFARIMLAASFASVLLEPLQQRIIYLHLWKDSRSGKTASQKAAISVWGDPEGLMVSYNSTQVGFERTAAAMNHLPLALDELQSSTMKAEQFARMTYMLGNGVGRMRGDKYGGTQELLHWHNVILSTGEQPIITENSLDGVVTRVMDLCAAPITDEAFAAEVHRISETNYGFAGGEFITWLYENYLNDGVKQLRAEYEKMEENISFMYDLCEGRDAGFYLPSVAVIAYADALSSQVLFGAEKDEAENDAISLAMEILRCIHSQEKADSIDRAWDYIVDWAKSNKMHFEAKKRLGTGFDRAAISPILGRYFPAEKKVAFIPSCLYKALEDGGYSVEKCYTGFKERGYIEKTQKQTRIDGGNPKTIYAKIELDLKAWDEDEGEAFLN